MLTSVSRRMAAEFFGNVEKAIAGGPAEPAATADPGVAVGAATGGGAPSPTAGGTVFTAPAKAPALGSQQDFLTGVAVGAGLVVLGAVVGGILGRRR
jgi:hypothetical protein